MATKIRRNPARTGPRRGPAGRFGAFGVTKGKRAQVAAWTLGSERRDVPDAGTVAETDEKGKKPSRCRSGGARGQGGDRSGGTVPLVQVHLLRLPVLRPRADLL